MINLTEAAAKRIEKIKTEENMGGEFYLRVGVRGGGCAGFYYELDMSDSELQPMDEEFESKGVKIVTNQLCLQYLEGVTIDFISGLMNSGFKFLNPAAKSTCGCGASFS